MYTTVPHVIFEPSQLFAFRHAEDCREAARQGLNGVESIVAVFKPRTEMDPTEIGFRQKLQRREARSKDAGKTRQHEQTYVVSWAVCFGLHTCREGRAAAAAAGKRYTPKANSETKRGIHVGVG